ncbi:MAG TPA: 8-oxo-dGTP diphosphatase MutT [bacterium]|jgi:mutator protein MutT|nr:8-oxo-dGTP diphosphatase MutT [bacterium]
MSDQTSDGFKIVGVGVVEKDGKVLITQRKYDDHLGGVWEFPGGKKRPEEDDQACIERELQEELGITVKAGAHLQTIRYSYPDRRLELRFYSCSLEGGDPKAVEVQDFRWVLPAELIYYQFPKADRDLVERLARRGEKN